MAIAAPAHLTPRKRPRQTRAAVTLDAIFEATVQVLLRDGLRNLTTRRVAERAGVSAGTLYQYFPHKQALIYALNERYLEALAERIESTCRSQHGAPLDGMIDALVNTYWLAKTERADVTRALYRSVVEIDNEAIVEAFAARVDAATATMLASASDASFRNPGSVGLTLVTVIFGTVRNAFERGLSATATQDMHQQLLLMCRSYLRATQE